MTKENQHLTWLKAARDKQVIHRRQVVSALAGEYKRGHTENMRTTLIEIVAAIQAIDCAIEDEQRLTGKFATDRRLSAED